MAGLHANLKSTPSMATLLPRLQTILGDIELSKLLLTYSGPDAQKLLDFFQSLLDMPGLDQAFRRRVIVATQRLSKTSGLYPTCYELKGVVQESEHPIMAGGFADIYKGTFQGQEVCIKAIRIYQNTEVEHFLKQVSKEAVLWGQLRNLNLVPIYGIYRFKNQLCLVAPWMEHGDIITYLNNNPQAPRLSLANDVAHGLSYLHANGIIHGDLKGPNILIDDVGRARVTDFGISSISDSDIVAWTSHSSAGSKGGSVRWQAPELFDMENDELVKNSRASDVYAYACVCFEIFTGKVPFFNMPRDAAVIHQIKLGVRPARPSESSLSWSVWGLTEDIWSLMEDCWKAEPEVRPTISEAIKRLRPELAPGDRTNSDSRIPSPRSFRRGLHGSSGVMASHGTVNAHTLRSIEILLARIGGNFGPHEQPLTESPTSLQASSINLPSRESSSATSDVKSVGSQPTIFTTLNSHGESSDTNVPSTKLFNTPLSRTTIMTPAWDDVTFKFISPSGIAYQFRARKDYKQVRESVAERLQADPFFNVALYSHFSLCPDPKDFHISYKDEYGDNIAITTNDAIADAVRVFQRAGKGCIVLKLQGRWKVLLWVKPGISLGRVVGDSSWRDNHVEPKENIGALVTRLKAVFKTDVQYKQFLHCTDGDAQKLLDMLQNLLDAPDLDTKFWCQLIVATQRLSHSAGLYSDCPNLGEIQMVSEHRIDVGSFAHIYKGHFRGQVVCLKVFKIYEGSDLQLLLKRFSAEAILRGQLSHLNILPFYGLSPYGGRLCLVSPWMEYGNITEFLKHYPDENRGLLVLDVGSGISYLHTHNIVHGGIIGVNILVTSCRRACLSGFSLSSVSDLAIPHWGPHSPASSVGGYTRWQAPELFNPKINVSFQNTKASDVYAFSCLAYEIFTGNVPFFEHHSEYVVVFKVSSGKRPSRPPSSSLAWGPRGLTETVWLLMEACWSTNPSQRPNINDVVFQLSSTTVVDDRPFESEDAILSSVAFRNSVGGRAALPSVEEFEEILTRGYIGDINGQ